MEPLRERHDLNLRHCILMGDACDALVTGILGLESLTPLNPRTTDKLKHCAHVAKLDKDLVWFMSTVCCVTQCVVVI